MYSDYWKEEENKDVIDLDNGFLAYTVLKDVKEFFVTDMFVKPKFRHTGLGQELGRMAENLALEFGCTKMSCNIWVKDPVTTTRKVRIFNDFGFNIVSTGVGHITMVKEIKK